MTASTDCSASPSSATSRARCATGSSCAPTSTGRWAAASTRCCCSGCRTTRPAANSNWGYSHPSWYARQGYMVVVQDTRGRYTSDGEFYPFLNEAEDGYDTIEWAAALPGSNGRVGMYGFSYPGAVQLLAATLQPPSLVTICPGFTGSQFYDGWTYNQGAFALAFAAPWAAFLALDTARRTRRRGRHASAARRRSEARTACTGRCRSRRGRPSSSATRRTSPTGSITRPTTTTGGAGASTRTTAACACRGSTSAAGTTRSFPAWSRTSSRCTGSPAASRSS